MKRVSSGILMSLLVPMLLHAQDLPSRFARSVSADSMHTSFATRAIGWTERDSSSATESHAVRNGAIVGAIIGLVGGGYGGSLIGTGCLVSAPASGGSYPPCHDRAQHNQFIIGGAVVGGLAVGLVGAVAGKVWHWLD